MKMRCLTVATRIAFCLSAVAVCGVSDTFARQADPTAGRIVSIQPTNPPGKLRVRQGWNAQEADATVGMPVRRGHLLRLAPDARAVVFCDDGKKHDLRPGQSQGCPCVATTRGFIYGGSKIPKSRGSDTARADFPTLLSPRMGLLLTTRPTIRWSPIPTSKPGEDVTYNVIMRNDEGVPLWRREGVTGTELAYPDDAPELTRGGVYKAVVQTGRKSSTDENGPDLDFTVLSETDAKTLREREATIRLLELPDAQTRLLVADLYAAQGLFSESVELLMEVRKTLKEPAVLRLLGDLYAESALHRDAVKQYEEALSLSQMGSDIEGQALTFVSLGRSYSALEDRGRENAFLKRAVEAYQKLGEKVTADTLRDRGPIMIHRNRTR